MAATADRQLIGVLVLFLVLTWLFTGLRVYVRCLINKSWAADDSLLLTALASFTAYVGCALSGIPHGIGRHVAEIQSEDISQSLMLFWLLALLYTITTVLLRCSIAVFILRICVKRIHRAIVYATTGTVICFSIFYFFLVIFQCHPISYYWRRFEPNLKGTCIDPTVFPAASYAHSVVSASADWVLGLLPLWLVWHLRLDTRTKLAAGILLSCGMIAGFAAIIRVPFIYTLTVSDDFFFDLVSVVVWSAVEPGLGIVATAACVLRPLVRQLYGDSSFSVNRIRETHTQHSTWRHERIYGRKLFPNYAQRHQIGEEGIEMGGIVTSVLGNHKAERAIELGRKNHSATQRERPANESEEELTIEDNRIFVHRTVEVTRR